MTAPPPRPRTKREQRRVSIERILESALACIMERGYHSTTVADIAEDAGVTKGAVYFYFENKSALFMALLEEIEALIVGELEAKMAAAGVAPVHQLVAAIHAQGLLAANRSNHLVVFTIALVEFRGTGDPIEHRLRQIYDHLRQVIEGIIVRGQEAGQFNIGLTPSALTSIVLALEHGTLLEWYLRSSEMNGGDLVRAARTVLLDGILSQPAGGAPGGVRARSAKPQG